MGTEVTIVSKPMVDVCITSTLSDAQAIKRFSRGLTISELKARLETIVGAPASSMELEIFSAGDQFLQKMENDDALLGSYPVDDNCRIHVIDRSGGLMGEFYDVSKVEKFELPDEAYGQKSDSLRAFMKKQRLGRYNEEEMAKKKAQLAAHEEEQTTAATSISVGSRCKVEVPKQPTKLGTVMYVEPIYKATWNTKISLACKNTDQVYFNFWTTDFKPGYWVGVKYDEPLGKHNGTVDGRKYFECEDKYGAFVRPLNVIVGDFPEEDYGLDEI